MSELFEKAVALVLAKEGGYQKHKNDTGNYNRYGVLVGTNLGISAPVYERFMKRSVSEADMRAIDKDRAKQIYHRLFWLPIRADEIKCEALAVALFDWYVNAGTPAVKALQSMVGAETDGKIGRKTLYAIDAFLFDYGCEAAIVEYTKLREDFYHRLVEKKPKNKVFLSGWLARTRQVFAYIKKMLPTLFTVLIFSVVCFAQDIERTEIAYTQMNVKGKPVSLREGGYLEMRNGFVLLTTDAGKIFKVVKDSSATHVRQLFLSDKLSFDQTKDPDKWLMPMVIFYNREKLDRAKFVISKKVFFDIVFR